MFDPRRNIHPHHRDQQIRRLTTSVVLHLIAVGILIATLFALLAR
jgi:membrane protein involved in colicin uptake